MRILSCSAPMLPLIAFKNALVMTPNEVKGAEMLFPYFGHWLNNFEILPSGSKIALFLLAWVILWLPMALLLGKKLDWQPFQPLNAAQKLPLLVPLYLIVPWLAWLMLRLEGTTLSDYGLSWRSQLGVSLILGILMGVGGLGIIFGLESRLGWLKWHPENLIPLGRVALPILGLALWVGITEELVFRGIFQTILEQDYQRWVAASIASSIFALVHLFWERKETLPQLPGLWIMGMVLVFARIVDQSSLGLAWGLHAGWVWGLSCLDAAQLISYQDQSIEWMIGINKQPLAGIMGILCLLGTGLMLWQWPHF